MLDATRFRFLPFRPLALLLMLGALASSCQSSRAGFSFQPVRLRAAVAPPVAAPWVPAVTAAATTSAENTGASVAAEHGGVGLLASPAAPLPATRSASKRVSTAIAATEAASESPAAPAAAPKPAPFQAAALAAGSSEALLGRSVAYRVDAPRHRSWRHRAQAPARQGLGLTVLGLLGMVGLAVALVGLAISGGGLGWTIAAAVAAGVVLLAYLDPGGH